MSAHPFTPDDNFNVELPNLSLVEQHLLSIYWCKKELDEFLPQIATYATPQEMAAIALSQVAVMEKHLVEVLRGISDKQLPRES